MIRNRSRVATLLAVLLAVSLIAIGGATAAFVTGGDLAGDGTDTVTGFAADSGVNETIRYNTTTSSSTLDDFDTLQLEVTYDNVTHATYTQSDASVVSGGSDSTNGLEVAYTVEHADLDTLPGAPNEWTNVTMEVTEIDTNGNEYNDTATVAYEFSNTRSVIYPAEGTTDASDLTVEAPEQGTIASTLDTVMFWSDEEDPDIATVDSTRSVDGSNTMISIYGAQSNASDALSTAAEGYDSSGDPVLGMTVTVDDSPVPVFYGSADEDIIDNTTDTYAVYDGTKTDVHLGDDYNDSTSVDVYVESQNVVDAAPDLEVEDLESAYNDELAVGDLRQEFGILDIGIIDYVAAGGPLAFIGGFLASGGLVIGLRRRDVEV